MSNAVFLFVLRVAHKSNVEGRVQNVEFLFVLRVAHNPTVIVE